VGENMKSIGHESWECLECDKNCVITLFGDTTEGKKLVKGSICCNAEEVVELNCFLFEEGVLWKLLHRQIGE
jgi:hypothetical protein